MAMMKEELALMECDDTKTIDLLDFSKVLNELFEKIVCGTLKVEPWYGGDSADVSEHGKYGVLLSCEGYELNYLVLLTGKSPLEAVRAIINAIPNALKHMQEYENGKDEEVEF